MLKLLTNTVSIIYAYVTSVECVLLLPGRHPSQYQHHEIRIHCYQRVYIPSWDRLFPTWALVRGTEVRCHHGRCGLECVISLLALEIGTILQVIKAFEVEL